MMTYDEFEKLFDAMDDKPGLFHAKDESPLVKLSRFSREHPATYANYRNQMKRKNERKYYKSGMPWE